MYINDPGVEQQLGDNNLGCETGIKTNADNPCFKHSKFLEWHHDEDTNKFSYGSGKIQQDGQQRLTKPPTKAYIVLKR